MKTVMYVISAVQLCISTKIASPEKAEGTKHRASTSKSRGTCPPVYPWIYAQESINLRIKDYYQDTHKLVIDHISLRSFHPFYYRAAWNATRS